MLAAKRTLPILLRQARPLVQFPLQSPVAVYHLARKMSTDIVPVYTKNAAFRESPAQPMLGPIDSPKRY